DSFSLQFPLEIGVNKLILAGSELTVHLYTDLLSIHLTNKKTSLFARRGMVCHFQAGKMMNPAALAAIEEDQPPKNSEQEIAPGQLNFLAFSALGAA
ncbi:MAG: hypothetical protein R6U84_00480, partial [Candidatus Cloacimonadales bacterium]